MWSIDKVDYITLFLMYLYYWTQLLSKHCWLMAKINVSISTRLNHNIRSQYLVHNEVKSRLSWYVLLITECNNNDTLSSYYVLTIIRMCSTLYLIVFIIWYNAMYLAKSIIWKLFYLIQIFFLVWKLLAKFIF